MKNKSIFNGLITCVLVLTVALSSCSNLIVELRGRTPTFTIAIEGITNGTVTADKTSAQKDETVKLSIASNIGYELDTLIVKDADNNAIATTEVTTRTTYTFVMPEGNVTVSATFEDMLAMIDVTRSTVTVIGADPSFIDSEVNDNAKGVFRRGSNVTLSPYSMSKYQVTQGVYAQYMAVENINGTALASEPSFCKETGTYPLVSGEVQSKRPVEGVTWFDAMYFCNVLTERTLGADKKVYTIINPFVDRNGHITRASVTQDITKTGYRLPTQAEWEFAARGGDTTATDWNYMFSGHDKTAGSAFMDQKNSGMDSVGWYLHNTKTGTTGNEVPSLETTGYGTHEVGKKSPNRLGICDMSGNLWEWCWGWYDSSSVVVRGGDWSSTLARSCAVCSSRTDTPGCCYDYIGIRLVRSIQ